MIVLHEGIAIQTRSYESAHECTVNMNKADRYYSGKNESVIIEMRNKENITIAKLETIKQ